MLVICNGCLCSVCVFLLTLSSSCFYSFSLCQHIHTQARKVVSMCGCALVHVLVICNCYENESILTLYHASSIHLCTHAHTFSQHTAQESNRRSDGATRFGGGSMTDQQLALKLSNRWPSKSSYAARSAGKAHSGRGLSTEYT